MKRRNFFIWSSLVFLGTFLTKYGRELLAQPQDSVKLASNSQTDDNSLSFYVSPNGNDKWSGKLAQPNNNKTDGPFATLERAKTAIRQLKTANGETLEQPITIFLREGNYFLNTPITFTPEDSGTEDYPITYQAYEDEKPVISGGMRIASNWSSETLNGRKVLTTKVSEVAARKLFFRQLWVDGERRFRARSPKNGYLRIASVPNASKSWGVGQNSFIYNAGDLKNWSTIDQAEVVILQRWLESRLPVQRVDESQRRIYFTKNSAIRIEPTDPKNMGSSYYYIENVLELLDSPGEWFLDRRTGKLYYMPVAGENLAEAEVIVPRLKSLMVLDGAEYLNFEGLIFAHADWYYTSDMKVSGASKAAYVPGAIIGRKIRYCNWENCTFTHMSNFGIEFTDGSNNCTVDDCEFSDLGAGGVKIAHFDSKTQVPNSDPYKIDILNSHIYNGGLIFHGAYAIESFRSSENQIARNHIHHFYSGGILCGWHDWKATKIEKNTIESNYIHDLGSVLEDGNVFLNDKGAIHTLGHQSGTQLVSNVIHNIETFNFGGWGIYLDNDSSFILVENNLVYQTRDGGFHLHYGQDNVVRNNIFAFGEIAQISRTRNENHLSFTFENNIVYWDTGKLLEGQWDDFNFEFDRNLYWQVNNEAIRFNGLSWEQWQAKGMDENSRIAEPLFVAPERGNFQLKSSSPAFQLGFQAIETVL
jgi:parallel beta-helix repeat protein